MAARSCTSALAALAVLALVAGCGDDEQPAGTAPEAERPATATTAGQAPERRSCGQVAFAPNSDAGAFEITATGVDCETARAVAAAAEGAGQRFSAEGFTCRGTREEGALPSIDFTCRRDGARIRFSAS